jgi:hypothetical protein
MLALASALVPAEPWAHRRASLGLPVVVEDLLRCLHEIRRSSASPSDVERAHRGAGM